MSCSNLSSIAKLLLLSCARQIQRRLRKRRGSCPQAKKISKGKDGNPRACRDEPAVTRIKRFQVVARSRMTSASGFRLDRPRAVAHFWGRGARILTEMNRIPQSEPTPTRHFLRCGRGNLSSSGNHAGQISNLPCFSSCGLDAKRGRFDAWLSKSMQVYDA